MNLFDLFVTIGVKDEASDKIPGIKATTVAAGQLMADAAKTAGRAVVDLTNKVINGYADYEQLVGGVETLFGAGGKSVNEYAVSVGKSVEQLGGEYANLMIAQSAVLKNADEAYKTAGLSANQYMETVTSFSASLIQSLGGDTVKAAQMADMAIIDMSDNANKMGTDMSMIQNAYNGFAKQNFTMLDNLKLGYGGTQKEMQRLLEDAEKLSGVEYDMSSYADIVEAIHVVQTEMGITGTTAEEAAGTISGSVSAMKAAWENLTVGFADENANIDVLLDNFLQSVETVAGNILPVVERVLTNIFGTLEENAPEIIAAGAKLLGRLIAGIIGTIPDLIANIPVIVSAIVDGFAENGPEFVEIGKTIVQGVWEGIKSLGSWIGGKVSDFFGGIVAGAKEALGIHSPSRVFAGIGENMALGVGTGWDSEYSSIKNGIESGLNFGTANVGFNSSGVGAMSRSLAVAGASSGEIVFEAPVYVGGAVVARNQYRFNMAEAQRRGGSLVNT